MSKDFWNERYKAEEYAYGEEPNSFLKQQLPHLPLGKVLFAAEGEGRNAVFGARLGFEAHAFDMCEEGKTKCEKLAAKHGQQVEYLVLDAMDLPYKEQSFDALVLIYAHFPAEQKSQIHQQLAKLVKAGGHLIFEAFAKDHVKYNAKDWSVGGPRDLAMLFSKEEIVNDFKEFRFQILGEQEVELHEGLYHNGLGWVLRARATKMS